MQSARTITLAFKRFELFPLELCHKIVSVYNLKTVQAIFTKLHININQHLTTCWRRARTLAFILFELLPFEIRPSQNHVRSVTWNLFKISSRNFMYISINIRRRAERQNHNSCVYTFWVIRFGTLSVTKSCPSITWKPFKMSSRNFILIRRLSKRKNHNSCMYTFWVISLGISLVNINVRWMYNTIWHQNRCVCGGVGGGGEGAGKGGHLCFCRQTNSSWTLNSVVLNLWQRVHKTKSKSTFEKIYSNRFRFVFNVSNSTKCIDEWSCLNRKLPEDTGDQQRPRSCSFVQSDQDVHYLVIKCLRNTDSVYSDQTTDA